MHPTFECTNVTGQMVALRETLKLLFEKSNGFLDFMKKHMQDTVSNKKVFFNFIQGPLWKNKIINCNDKTILPIFLYFDDYETGDPLGSHAAKK